MSGTPRRRQRSFKPGPIAHHRKGKPASADQLRKWFNDFRILEKVQKGEFTERILRSGHPSPPVAAEPICTQSQLVAYIDAGGKKVAEAHRYLRTDGTVGASGLPDPKELLREGIVYYLDIP